MSLSRKTLEHPVLVLIVFVLLGIIGISSFNNIAISLFPDIDSPYVMVLTTYSNAGPESVEKSVTKVLESSLISVNGLKELTSSSSEGSSMVFLEFDYGTDLESAVNDVRDKLDRVKRSLPDGASTPSIFKMDASAMPIMRIAMRGNRSTDDLRQIAEDDVIDILEQSPKRAFRADAQKSSVSKSRKTGLPLTVSTYLPYRPRSQSKTSNSAAERLPKEK